MTTGDRSGDLTMELPVTRTPVAIPSIDERFEGGCATVQVGTVGTPLHTPAAPPAILSRRMRFHFNPFREAGPNKPRDYSEIRAFHRRLPGYDPTPLHECRRLAKSLGVGNIYVKDESSRFGLNAFKALGASWAMHRVAASTRPIGFAAATDGNHGRAVAWMAQRMGVPATIFVPANTVQGRIAAIRREGAEVRVVAGTYDDTVRHCAEISSANGWQVISDTGYQGYLEIPQWIADGYSTLFAEFEEQRTCRNLLSPDLVLVQAGVGGLLSSAVAHFRYFDAPPLLLVAVEPDDADCLLESITSPGGEPRPAKGTQNSFMACLNCGEVSLTAWPAVRRGVDLFLAIEDRFAVDAMRTFANAALGDPPIAAGESGAAGIAGLLALCCDSRFGEARERLRIGPATKVLLLSTEGPTGTVQ